MKWKTNAKYGKPDESGTIFTNKDVPIQVHGIHGCPGWYLSCSDLNISGLPLNADSFEEAVKNSKILISKRIGEIVNKYNSFIKDESETEIVRY